MKAPTKDRIKNLPKWARQHIADLESEVERLTVALEDERDYKAGTATTSVWLDNALDPKTYLPERSRVAFRFGDGTYDYIQVRKLDDSFGSPGVEVYANKAITVLPVAANLIRVTEAP